MFKYVMEKKWTLWGEKWKILKRSKENFRATICSVWEIHLWIINWLGTVEDMNCELEDTEIETIQIEQQKKKIVIEQFLSDSRNIPSGLM